MNVFRVEEVESNQGNYNTIFIEKFWKYQTIILILLMYDENASKYYDNIVQCC